MKQFIRLTGMQLAEIVKSYEVAKGMTYMCHSALGTFDRMTYININQPILTAYIFIFTLT